MVEISSQKSEQALQRECGKPLREVHGGKSKDRACERENGHPVFSLPSAILPQLCKTHPG